MRDVRTEGTRIADLRSKSAPNWPLHGPQTQSRATNWLGL